MSVVNAGLAGITASLIAETYKYLELGSGDTAVAAADTTLETIITASGLTRADATETQETTTVADDTLQLTHQWTAAASATVKEVGIFDASSAGVMLCRKVLTTPVSLTSGDTYTYTYSVSFA